MILFNDTILFVHNPKTAGTSMLSYLKESLPGPIYMAGVQQLGTNHPSLSMAIGYAFAITGRNRFDSIISVIRNPFDREVSMYAHFRKKVSRNPGLHVDLPDLAMRRRVLRSTELDFRAYLRWLWEEQGTVDVWQSRCFYQAPELDPSVVKVIRFEHLDEDLSLALGAKIRLPKSNESERGATIDYYDEETTDIVRQSYAWIFSEGHYPSTVPAASG